jgi:hypothetical protein
MMFRCRRSGCGCGAASAATSAPMRGRTGKSDGTGCLGRGDDQDDSLPPSRAGIPSATFQAVPLFWLNYLKTQTSYSLKLHDVRKAAAAYELMHSAAAMLQMLPVPVLEALRDYVQEEVKDRKGPLTLCERSFVEHLNELIRGARLKEHRLFHGITGIVPDPDEDEKKSS